MWRPVKRDVNSKGAECHIITQIKMQVSHRHLNNEILGKCLLLRFPDEIFAHYPLGARRYVDQKGIMM